MWWFNLSHCVLCPSYWSANHIVMPLSCRASAKKGREAGREGEGKREREGGGGEQWGGGERERQVNREIEKWRGRREIGDWGVAGEQER